MGHCVSVLLSVFPFSHLLSGTQYRSTWYPERKLASFNRCFEHLFSSFYKYQKEFIYQVRRQITRENSHGEPVLSRITDHTTLNRSRFNFEKKCGFAAGLSKSYRRRKLKSYALHSLSIKSNYNTKIKGHQPLMK